MTAAVVVTDGSTRQRAVVATASLLVVVSVVVGNGLFEQLERRAGWSVAQATLWRSLLGILVVLVVGTAALLVVAGASRSEVRSRSAAPRRVGAAASVTRIVPVGAVGAAPGGDRPEAPTGRTASTRTSAVGAAPDHAALAAVRASFVAAASHELRTPAAVIAGAAETLQAHRGRLDPRSEDALYDVLIRGGHRLAAIVDRLLEASSFVEQRVAPSPRRTDLAGLVDQVVAQRAPATVEVVAVPDVPAHVDTCLLARALQLLLDNVEDHAACPTHVTLSQDGDDLLVHVDDRGPGIAGAWHDEVFAPFGRVPDGRPAPGVGLGLYLVAEIARLHGGSASVGDSPQGGTRVTLHLPAVLV